MKRISLSAVLFVTVFSSALLAAEDGNQPQPENRDNYWCKFLDAVGEPIPQTKVQVFGENKIGEKILLKATSLDKWGNLREMNLSGEACEYTFIISHQDYGTSLREKAPFHQRRTYYLPLVRTGSEAAERSVRGVVLNPEGKPVAGAKIMGGVVIAPGGARIYGAGISHTVLTDQNGQFRMHLPIEPTLRAYEMPPHCEYQVGVDPPKGLGLIYYTGRVPNDREVEIVLDRAEYFRTFSFEDANGPITELEKLKVIYVCVRLPRNKPWYIRYPDWKDGRILPLGTFEAGMYSNRDEPFEMYEFEPVEVIAESPEQLVFKVKQKPADKDILYTGRVINGITGEPMEGVFVITAGWTSKDFAKITEQQWEELDALGHEPAPNNVAFLPIRRLWSYYNGPPEPYVPPLKRVIRTNDDGFYEFEVQNNERFDFIVAFGKGYIADKIMAERCKPDENNRVRLRDMRMYPAANVVFEPCIDIEHLDLRARLDFKGNEDVYWAEDFLSWYHNHRFALVEGKFKEIKTCCMQIPAGLNLRLHFFIAASTRDGDPWRCRIYSKNFEAEPRQTLDLGKIEFPNEMLVFVEVVDSAGEPVAGVGVVHWEADKNWKMGPAHTTDSNGFADFMVPPYYKGRFAVGYHDESGNFISESIVYQTNGPEDANNVYTLRVSDEILYHLFK